LFTICLFFVEGFENLGHALKKKMAHISGLDPLHFLHLEHASMHAPQLPVHPPQPTEEVELRPQQDGRPPPGCGGFYPPPPTTKCLIIEVLHLHYLLPVSLSQSLLCEDVFFLQRLYPT
jgi:hypothetical protein